MKLSRMGVCNGLRGHWLKDKVTANHNPSDAYWWVPSSFDNDGQAALQNGGKRPGKSHPLMEIDVRDNSWSVLQDHYPDKRG